MAIFYLLGLANLTGFLFMGLDKHKARKGKWRISEKLFWTFAFVGGSLGIYLGMHYFRHKTKHFRFIYGIPAIMIGQLILVIFLLHRFQA
jgi:uncharacterized membrane protein YsdA (DUF1294 family)